MQLLKAQVIVRQELKKTLPLQNLPCGHKNLWLMSVAKYDL